MALREMVAAHDLQRAQNRVAIRELREQVGRDAALMNG